MITLEYGGIDYTFPNLTDHPVGWEENETRRGRAARQWTVTGIVSREDAKTISDLFNAWSAARLPEGDPKETGEIGTTVNLTGQAPGFEWETPVECWITTAPTIAMAGCLARVSLVLVDAEEALAILLAEKEDENTPEEELELGQLTFGTAVVNLKAYPYGYTDLPTATPGPSGKHVITGPLNITRVLRVQGWVDATNLPLLEQWVEDTTSATPVSNDYFLTEWSEPVAEKRVQDGIMDIYYDVSFTVVIIK